MALVLLESTALIALPGLTMSPPRPPLSVSPVSQATCNKPLFAATMSGAPVPAGAAGAARTGGAPSAAPSGSPREWAERIRLLHAAKMTPEARAALERRAEVARRALMTRVEAHTTQLRSAAVFESAAGALEEARSAVAAAPAGLARGAAWGAVGARAAGIAASAAARPRFAVDAPVPLRALAPGAAPDRGYVAAMSVAAAAAVADAGIDLDALADAAPAAPAAEEGAAAFADLLEQLREEPADGEETAAKFRIFETYMDTVTALREDMLATWRRAVPSFEPPAAAVIDRAISAMDRGDALGAAEVAGTWFVHGMMVQAGRNHAALAGILRDIETKLALLSGDADCPICLDSIAARAARALPCCHRVHGDCWEAWGEANPVSAAFCPLCRGPAAFFEALTMIAAPP
jgi:hypothetical protein